MRKILTAILVVITMSINAQIFTQKTVIDKFDDVEFTKELKSIIDKSDSTIVLEEKGGNKAIFVILNPLEINCAGRADSIVNIVGNVYGYQECWSTVLAEDASEYMQQYIKCIFEEDKEESDKKIKSLIMDYCYYVTHRVVVSKYTHTLESEYYWISKADRDGRVVYSKNYY